MNILLYRLHHDHTCTVDCSIDYDVHKMLNYRKMLKIQFQKNVQYYWILQNNYTKSAYIDSGLGFRRDLLGLGNAGCWAFTRREVTTGKLGIGVIVS